MYKNWKYDARCSLVLARYSVIKWRAHARLARGSGFQYSARSQLGFLPLGGSLSSSEKSSNMAKIWGNMKSIFVQYKVAPLLPWSDSETYFRLPSPSLVVVAVMPCHCRSQIKETVDEWMVDANVPLLLLLPQLNPSLLSKRSSPFIWLSSF